jgi:hypothetical protein
MYTGPLLLVSFGVYRAFVFARSRLGQAPAAAALAAVVAVPVTGMSLSGLTAMVRLALTDTRAASRQWCAEQGITPQNSLFDGYSPFVPSAARSLDYSDASAAQYVVVSSDVYSRFYSDRTRFADRVALYDRVFSLPLVREFVPLQRPAVRWELANIRAQLEFLKRSCGGAGAAYSGPRISIYRNRP